MNTCPYLSNYTKLPQTEWNALEQRLLSLSVKYSHNFTTAHCQFEAQIKEAIRVAMPEIEFPAEFDDETGWSAKDLKLTPQQLYNELMGSYDETNSPFYKQNFVEVAEQSFFNDTWPSKTDLGLCELAIAYWVPIELQNFINNFFECEVGYYDAA